MPSVEPTRAAEQQRCCTKVDLSCAAAGASAAILLERYRAPPIPQACERADVLQTEVSATLRVAQTCCSGTHAATQTHPHACSVYRMRATCLCIRSRSHAACHSARLCPRTPHEPWPEIIFESARTGRHFELGSSGFIPSKLAVAVGVRGGGRQAREGAIGLDRLVRARKHAASREATSGRL